MAGRGWMAVAAGLASAGALALAGAFPVSAQARTTACKNTRGGDVIVATNLGCVQARRTVRRWAVLYAQDGRHTRRVGDFYCRGQVDRYEGLTIRCSRGTRKIRFYANVPDALRATA